MKPFNLKHAGYTALLSNSGQTHTEEYEGRSRITSLSKKINGGVYMPVVMEKEMEAIVVDYQKDQALRKYLEELDDYIAMLARRLQSAGRQMDFEDILSSICHKITADFPYSERMCDKNYLLTKYAAGKKTHLGVMMTNQDMICRHMGLLVGAAIDYFKDNFVQNKSGVKLKPDTEMGFMADIARDLEESKSNGHAYLVVRKPEKNGPKNKVFVVDPAAGRVMDVGKALESKDPRGRGFYRYAFSALRFLFQDYSSADNHLLTRFLDLAAKDPTLQQVIKDVKNNLKDPNSIRAFYAFDAKKNLRGVL
ncbi:hypothetical protein IT411_02360 [Candidatus Peregrinibacteria bacterium]|nr:hypothetical protein [Candidatus Peregrinibacteria bacterium]